MPRTGEMIESKFLKKEDVGEDGTIVTVGAVTRVNVAMQGDTPEYRWTMQFDEFDKPMVLNSTNIKLAEKAFASDNTDDWIGKKIICYNDPNISFGKEIVGGIRLKAYRKAAPPRDPSAGKPVRGPVDDLKDDVPF